jgi:spore coat protein U-like protein
MSVSISRKVLFSGLGIFLTLAASFHTVSAGTSTGTLTVTASVAGVCTIGNATLAFGTYNPTAATAINMTSTVTLTCSLGTPYNIGMSAGSGTGATTSSRLMTAGSTTLGYNLYRDSGYSLNWGNTVGTDTLSGTSSTSALTNTITIYGQIPAGENAAVGSYTDTVTMTVTY